MANPICTEEVCEIARKLKEGGNSDQAIFTALDISKMTYYNWIKWGEAAADKLSQGKKLTQNEQSYYTFLTAVKKGKQRAIEIVISSLMKSAQGYSAEEVKEIIKDGKVVKAETITKHIAPNVAAAIFLICNFDPDNFKNTRQITGSADEPLRFEIVEVSAKDG